MTREEVKKILPILQAFAEGKDIEYFDTASNIWRKSIDPAFDKGVNYQIKPEPNYRPFANAEECWKEMLKHQPFGWIKAKLNGKYMANYCPNKEGSIDLYYHIRKVAPSYIKYDDVDDYCEIFGEDKHYEDVFKTVVFYDGAPFGAKVEKRVEYEHRRHKEL